MKNTTMIIGIVIILAIAGIFIFSSSGISTSSSGSSSSNSQHVQNIVLSMKNGNYYPNTFTVKAGIPVAVSLDNSIGGCYRSFTIRQLGLQKNLATPSDTLTFTPTERGTYRFACIMGMGYGTMIVQ